MATTFAERLRWARYYGPAAQKAGKQIGATILARESGCAQSLISSLERQNARGSEHNNKFAKVLGIDPHWLATGLGDGPASFDEKVAHELRAKGGSGLLSIAYSAARPATPAASVVVPDFSAEPQGMTRDKAAALQKAILSNFIEFSNVGGKDKAIAFAELLKQFAETQVSAAEKVKGE